MLHSKVANFVYIILPELLFSAVYEQKSSSYVIDNNASTITYKNVLLITSTLEFRMLGRYYPTASQR